MKQILITALLSFAILAGNAQSRIPMTNKGQSGFDYLYSYSTRIDIALMELEDRVKKLERKIGDLGFSLEQERMHRTFERSIDTTSTTTWMSDDVRKFPVDSVFLDSSMISKIYRLPIWLSGDINTPANTSPLFIGSSISSFDQWANRNYILRAGQTGPYWNRRYDPTGARFTDVQLWRIFKRRNKL